MDLTKLHFLQLASVLPKKHFPTFETVQQKLQDGIHMQGCSTTLRTVLKELGFGWWKTMLQHLLLIESSELSDKRRVTSMQLFRIGNHCIICMDELYVLSSHMFSKSPGVTFL
jgi:hypothetical protein